MQHSACSSQDLNSLNFKVVIIYDCNFEIYTIDDIIMVRLSGIVEMLWLYMDKGCGVIITHGQ